MASTSSLPMVLLCSIHIPSPRPSSCSVQNKKLIPTTLKCVLTKSPNHASEQHTAYKLQHIVSEFQSLPEPIDRVKRLLHYASILPGLDESRVRTLSNRVAGCTVQVWVDVSMDELGRMRFFADSDSEIMKGFCSCLVWLLDGAFPEEVLSLRVDDLWVLNVGLNGRERSRVNTWQNVLISMQGRTEVIVGDRVGKLGIDPLQENLQAVV